MANLVSWRDYGGIKGFGTATEADMDALNADLRRPDEAFNSDGFSLRVFSIYRTRANLVRNYPSFWGTNDDTRFARVTPAERLISVTDFVDQRRRKTTVVAQLEAELLADADAMRSLVKVFGMLLRWDQELRQTAASVMTGGQP